MARRRNIVLGSIARDRAGTTGAGRYKQRNVAARDERGRLLRIDFPPLYRGAPFRDIVTYDSRYNARRRTVRYR